jgi:hypothetical protein
MAVEYTKVELLEVINDTIGFLQATKETVQGLPDDGAVVPIAIGPNPLIIPGGHCEKILHRDLLLDFMRDLEGMHRSIERLRRYGSAPLPQP